MRPNCRAPSVRYFRSYRTWTCSSAAFPARTTPSRKRSGRPTVSSARKASCGGRFTGSFAETAGRADRSSTYSSRTSIDSSKSPSGQRGRDFAVMLASLADLGYEVEWRVVNAADYGFPQKRRRVFIVGRLGRHRVPETQMLLDGVLARALPVQSRALRLVARCISTVTSRPSATHSPWARRRHPSPTPASCVSGQDREPPCGRSMSGRHAGATSRSAISSKPMRSPRTVLRRPARPPQVAVPQGCQELTRISQLDRACAYTYDEGSIPFPDSMDRPSRTHPDRRGWRDRVSLQTSDPDRRRTYRTVDPESWSALNGFPGDWTAGMSDGKRAFMMGNALVVGLVERIADALIAEIAHPVAIPETALPPPRPSISWPASSSRTRHLAVQPSVTSCGPTGPATPDPSALRGPA